MRLPLLLAASALATGGIQANEKPPARDASLAAGRPLAPITVRWRPERQVSPLPPWAPAPVEIQEGAAVFHVPARWKHPSADRYVLTVVFEDTEDGGPIVEWRSAGGITTRLSEGLGESEEALGLHARTIVLPDAMTRDGGAVVVSMPWRIEGLVSASLRPARDATVAVPGARSQPGLVGRAGLAIESEELEGREVLPMPGDVREGSLVEAELSAGIEFLDGDVEWRVPIEGGVEGAMIVCEVLGLEPSDRLELVVNSVAAGELHAAAFRLDDPEVTPEPGGDLRLAGWRKHSLYFPASLLRTGENSILLRRRPPTQAGPGSLQPVALKNTFLHLRFGGVAPQPAHVPPAWPVDLTDSGEPDLTAPVAIVQEPPPLPAVLTAPRPPRKPASEPLVITAPLPRAIPRP